MGALREKWFEGNSLCTAEGEEKTTAGLTFDNIGGIFYLFAGGCLMSVIISLMENVWFKFMRFAHFFICFSSRGCICDNSHKVILCWQPNDSLTFSIMSI